MKNQLLSVVTAVTILFSPIIILAQNPGLGGAANFVLFSTNGAVSNIGTTYLTRLTGNVGTNNGAITGFGNVNGVMRNADTATARAATDLLKAYNYLDTLTATLAHAPLLGNGDSLVAGVYAIAGNTSLDLNLILDAKGNPNAVFVFKISGTFSTSANSRVILANNALACNVYWKVEGAVTAATRSSLKGNIIVNNAAITFGALDTLEGRALTTTGAIEVNHALGYIPAGCGSVLLTGPVAPNYRSAGCFALFSGNGAVTNSDTSHVTGDIGTNVGLTTGFDPLYVTGYIHPIPDTYTAAAAADLLLVYDYLNLLPVDINLLYPAQFGRSLILTPHTYLMTGAVTFTDSLYLNGQGNFNSVFVIKTKGAFSTSNFSKVYLINGAQAKNVYWLVDGAVDITGNSIFNGNIIANNGALALRAGVTMNGRAQTTSGELTTARIIATSPSGNCNLLPVSWLYFRGKPAANTVLLEWSSSNEINNGFYTIEKSSDGITFEKLATIKAAGEANKLEYTYSYIDKHPYSLGYYRISQTDKDGKKNYFRTIKVKVNVSENISVFSYVQGNYLYVQASGAAPANGFMELYSIDGKKLFSQKIVLTRELSRYKVEKPLQKGMYLLDIVSRGEQLYRGKAMVP